MQRIIKVILLQLFFFNLCIGQSSIVKYIWAHNKPNPRNDYVYFRNEFDVDASILSANIQIFADSRYQLWINEQFINFGPARSYPQNPEYDSYDISHFINKGKNVIAVKAL